jgi:predicted regulator of Ras-like GTPase activity (Roadblock/LC7/MglB family)
MDEVLDSLSNADGVFGAVVLDDHGTCLAHRLQAPFEPILLASVVKRLSTAFDAFSSIEDGEVTSFSVECQDGNILLRRVDQRWVVVLVYPEFNMNMLNVAMNVAARTLSRGEPGSGTQPGARGLAASVTNLPSATPSPSQPAAELAAPPDAVDRRVVQQLLAIYTDYLGPAAKLVFKQQLAAVGVTSRTLRRAQMDDFVARLTARIPVPQRQREFAAAVREYQERVPV